MIAGAGQRDRGRTGLDYLLSHLTFFAPTLYGHQRKNEQESVLGKANKKLRQII